MPELLRMPKVAAGATTATLCDWLVREDQQYSASDVLATIETDKAVVDFTADTDGVLLRVLVSAGTEAQVGAPIALDCAAWRDCAGCRRRLGLARRRVAASGDRVGIAGCGTRGASVTLRNRGSKRRHRRAVAAASSEGQDTRIFTSPLARRLAQEAGVATESITGTGPNGRIVRRDVELAIAAKKDGGSQALPTAPKPSRTGRHPIDGAYRVTAASRLERGGAFTAADIRRHAAFPNPQGDRPAFDREQTDDSSLLPARLCTGGRAAQVAIPAERDVSRQDLGQRLRDQGGGMRPHGGAGDERHLDG